MPSDQNHAEVILALDLGGTFIKSALFQDGKPIRKLPQIPSRSHEGKAEIAEALRQAIRQAGAFSRLAVSVPGPFDYEHGIFRMEHKFAAVNGCAFAALSGGIDGVFLHDAHAFLLGELAHGAARGFRRVGGVTLGTGLGTALAINGELLAGGDGSPAPEVKLWNVPFRDGIAEDVISARGLLAKFPAPDVKTIAEAARQGNCDARKVWREYGEALYELLGNWAERLTPEVIVIGGQIARDFALLGPVPAELPIRFAEHGEDAALYGAAEFARRRKQPPVYLPRPRANGSVETMKEFTLGTMYWINPRSTQAEIENDMAAIKANGFSLIRIIAWWELIEVHEGRYEFSHIDRVFRAAEKHGLRLMPTIGFYPPVWLAAKLDKIGKNEPGRYPVVMRAEMQTPLADLIRELVVRYRHSPALAIWNIWNEPTVNASLNRDRLARFCRWLKNQYEDLPTLREAWYDEYPVFSLLCPDSLEELGVEWLENAFHYGTRGRNAIIRCDWFRFLSEELNTEAAWLKAEVGKHDPEHPVHANLHSLSVNPLESGRNLFALSSVLDTVSCSIHTSNDYTGGKEFRAPLWNYSFAAAQCRSWCKNGKSAMVGELQAGTTDSHWCRYTPSAQEIRYELCRALGEGLDGVVFWLWRGWKTGTFELGEFSLRNPSDGAPTERSEEVRRFHERYAKYRSDIDKLKRPEAKIALFCSQQTQIYRMVLAQDRPFGLQNECQRALFGCFRALQEANYQIDFISEEEIGDGKLSCYQVLYMPMCEVVGKQTAEKIADFVRDGGGLYADGRCGWLDAPMYLRNTVPGNGLSGVFGAAEADFVMSRDPVSVRVGAERVCGTQMMQKLRCLQGAEATGFFADGSVAVVDHAFGKGRTRLAGSAFSLRLYDWSAPETSAWIAAFAGHCGVAAEFVLPYGVTGTRLTGVGGELWIFHNHSDKAEALEIPVAGRIQASFYGGEAEVRAGNFHGIVAPHVTEFFLIKMRS